jgi:hypothetical protein
MSVASDQTRRLFCGRHYDVVMNIAPPASKADGSYTDRCSSCGRSVLPIDPLVPKKALRRPPTRKAAVSFSTSEITCTKCAPDFSTLTS